MDDEQVIPIIEEHLHAEREPVKTGSVRVQKHVETRIERIEDDLIREAVDVRHVAVGRVVTEIPAIRRDGDVTIIPIVEEEITVTKQLVLKEEIHVTRRRTRERVVKEIPVQRETAVIERLDAEGRVIVQTAGESAPRPKRRKSLLDP